MHIETDRLTAELRVKNQELIDCRMTVAEFSLLLPKLEEQVNYTAHFIEGSRMTCFNFSRENLQQS